ncbi:hypothetical protein [Sulfurimonas sp.]
MKYILKLLGVLGILSQFVFAQTPQIRTQEFPQKELKKQNIQIATLAAQEMSKTLPQKVDKYTSIINIENDGTTLIYTFEINTGTKSDESVQKEDHSRMQKAITQGVCKSSKRFLLAGIDTTYVYISAKTKKILFKFKITKDKCANLVSQ